MTKFMLITVMYKNDGNELQVIHNIFDSIDQADEEMAWEFEQIMVWNDKFKEFEWWGYGREDYKIDPNVDMESSTYHYQMLPMERALLQDESIGIHAKWEIVPVSFTLEELEERKQKKRRRR